MLLKNELMLKLDKNHMMAPAQLLTDLDDQRKMETQRKIVSERAIEKFPNVKDDPDQRCMNNCQDNVFDMSTYQQEGHEAGDTVVNILDGDENSAQVAQDTDPDATEYSSSFGNTISGSDKGLHSNLSDAEVESQFHYDTEAAALFDGFDIRPRKKRLTAHWRRYIRQLMWRCKWIELRAKEFQSQALKYDKELLAYSYKKQYKLGQFGSENSAARSGPLSFQGGKRQVMKRRQRKRVEDTVDLPSYMMQHSLFSYFDNKRSEVDGGSIDDDCGNQVNVVDSSANAFDEFGVNYEWPMLESNNSNKSLEEILWGIEVLHSRVFKMKAQINKLMSKNAQKFTPMDNSSLFMPANRPSTSARSPVSSTGNGDDLLTEPVYTSPGQLSDYEFGDRFLSKSAASSFDEVASLPDIIESTVDFLSSVDVSLDQPEIGDSGADVVDDCLIHNQAAGKELHNLENANLHTDMPLGATEEQKTESATIPIMELEQCPAPPTDPVSELDLGTKTVLAAEKPSLRPCEGTEMKVSTNKRKRAGRRGNLGRWNAKKVYFRRFSVGKRT